MGQILQNWRILVAGMFSLVLVIVAYLLAAGTLRPPIAEASTESELLQAIATRDSDNDGLHDWEEALYGTSPSVADSNNLGMTDGEAVKRGLIVPKAIADIEVATSSPSAVMVDGVAAPAEGTLTATFTKSFFALYLEAKDAKGEAALTSADLQSIADQALSSLSASLLKAPDFKSAVDLKISGSGPDALKSFAANAEAVLLANTSTATTTELNYLKNAVEQNDQAAIAQLVSIAKTYRSSAVGLVALSVPQELAADHLLLVNAMMRISEITSDFARTNADPLASMLALQQYPQAVINLGTAFMHIATLYQAAGVLLAPGTPGAAFVSVIDSVPSGPAPQP